MIDLNKPIDYKAILSRILWRNSIVDKNRMSGFYEFIDSDRNEILDFDPMLLSYSIPKTREMTWKELSLKLGINVDLLVSDGHDCTKCPSEKDCHAYFKYHSLDEQEQCGWWQENVDNTVYEENLKKYKRD